MLFNGVFSQHTRDRIRKLNLMIHMQKKQKTNNKTAPCMAALRYKYPSKLSNSISPMTELIRMCRCEGCSEFRLDQIQRPIMRNTTFKRPMFQKDTAFKLKEVSQYQLQLSSLCFWKGHQNCEVWCRCTQSHLK